MPQAKIHFIWREKDIDIIEDYYDFDPHFNNDIDATFLFAELSPPIEDVSLIHFSDFLFQRSTLRVFNPIQRVFKLKNTEIITVTIVTPRKIFCTHMYLIF